MNARQKAKKYKMAYELLLKEKPHIVFHEITPQIDTLKFGMRLHKQEVLLGDSYIKAIVINGLVEELAKCPERYIDGYTEYLPYDPDYCHLHYQIKVLRRTNNDNNNA